jgi:hypothetical protein
MVRSSARAHRRPIAPDCFSLTESYSWASNKRAAVRPDRSVEAGSFISVDV